MNIAIVVIAYNRLKSLQRLVKTLENAFYDGDSVNLIISVDRSDNNETECWVKGYLWCHGSYEVRNHQVHLGLRNHIMECGDIVMDYDAIIALEDDITVTPNFYRFAKQCVQRYSDDERIAGISLYSFVRNFQNSLPFDPVKSEYDVFFMNIAQSWGQVWMKKQWMDFRAWYDKKAQAMKYAPHLPNIWRWEESSWLKYHIKYCLECNKYFVYPYYSLSTNNQEAGIHTVHADTYSQSILLALPQQRFNLVGLDDAIVKYDAFFEAKFLAQYLGVDDDDLCVDFHNEKLNRLGKRYWLTTSSQPYGVVCSFALQLKPYELNVIQNREGYQLFLYDTSISGVPPKIDKLALYHYLYNDSLECSISILGRVGVVKYLVFHSLGNKIKQLKKFLNC